MAGSGVGVLEGLLGAGALLSLGVEIPEGEPVDGVTARVYRHPVLGHPVVRLSPSVLAPGDDLEMEHLGFEAPDLGQEVAQQRRRGLGFPGWVLINDPARAPLALEVAREMRRSAGVASVKLGAARKGFEDLAVRLGGSAPHFLPSFWEEVGRIFVRAGSARYGSEAFGKAREAERVHALEVDEASRLMAFVDFALDGALSSGALSDYARDLELRHPGPEAWGHFRALCVRRTLSGLPPWAGMGRDLKRMARAAGLHVEAEEHRFLLDVLESPALVRAPMQFWRDFRKPLVAMTAGSAAVRGHLLNLMPGPRQSASYHGEWLDMLEEFGALEAVIQPAERVAPGAEAAGGAAAWLERLMSHFTHTWWSSTCIPVQLFGLLRRMAPRLIAEATPIRFEDTRWHWMDLDLLDLALELGVPVADPGPGAHLNLWRWSKHEADAERPRDPVSAAGDARFAAMFDRDMVKHFQDADFQKSIVGKAGFADAIRRWMSSNVRSLGFGTLSSAELSFNNLKSFACAEFWRDSPSAQFQVAEVQISRVLGRTLRGGIMDELGWPAFDEAAGDRKNLNIGGSFPNIVIWDGAAAEAIGPGGRIARVEMPLPAGATVLRMRCVEGRVLMCWRDGHMGMEALWSGAGESPFFPQIYLWNLTIDDAMELSGGGSFDGDRHLRAGDRVLGSAHIGVKALCDGESFWVMQPWGDDGAAFTEMEPATGKVGRQSRPAFIEGFLVEGEPLVKEVIRLQPLPEGLSWSPLGSSGGLVGWRARRSAALGGPVVAEGIDGRRREGALVDLGMLGANSQEEVPFGLMSWPGDDRLRPISAPRGMVKLWEPEGIDVLGRFEVVGGDESPFAAGSPRVLPPLWWHMLKPRDVAGSTALRSVSDEGAERLMAAGRAALEAAGGAVVELDGVREAIGEVLASVTHARLIAGIAGIVVHAARLERTLRELLPLWTSAQDDSPWGRMGRFLSQGADRPVVFKFGVLPWDMVGRVGAVAFKAVALGTGEEARAEALARLERWAASPLSDEGLAVRAFEAHLGGMKPAFAAPVEPEGEWGVEIDGRRYGLIVWEEWHADRLRCKAIEVSTREPDDAGEGVFAPLPGSEITSVRAAGGWNGAEHVGRLVALARERGPLPWSEATGSAIAARTGLSRAASALLWAGCPGLHIYSKNFLDKELREQLGLKVAEAATGRKELVECSTPDQRDQIWHEAMPLEVEALWSPLGEGADDPSSVVSRLCAAWNRVVGRRASVPEGLLQEAARGFQALYQAPTGILGWVAEPERAGVLNLDAEWRVTTQGRLQCRPPEAEGRMSPGHFEAPTLIAAVHYLPWLFMELPVGDPLRQNLVQVAERVWRRLSAPGLLFMAGLRYFHGEPEGAQAFFEAFGGEPFELTDEGSSTEDARGVDLGDRVITLVESRGAYNYSHVAIFFRPGRCADFAGLRALLDDPYSAWNGGLDASELMRSAGMAALIERVRSTPVPEGQYEANPLWSAPEVVEAARRRLSLSEDGAILYLQLLALAEPTAANVLRWNGWQPDRAKAAAQELVGAALVLEAKRARAGRHTFLPGGWQVLKAPHLPIETWKLPLYGVERTADGMKMPLRRVLPLRPLHVIFKEAFKRVERGEGPRYDAL